MAGTISTAFNGRKAYVHLRHLAEDIGPRLAGSPGEHKAARYIEKAFKSFGLTTRLQRYSSITFDNNGTVFEVEDGGRWRRVQCQPVTFSKGTRRGGVAGEIYFAETGAPEYLSPAMKGKIVLVCGRIAPEDRPRVLSYKPKALVIIEGGLGKEPRRTVLGKHDREMYGNLPMVSILHLDGLDIVKKQLKRARLTARVAERKSHSFNVIGEKIGTGCPDEVVVVCGHYDSCMGITGAADNAGGTAILIELARVLGAAPTRRTLRFVAFSAEETGLNGSVFYANDLARRAEREKKKKSFRDKIDKTELDGHTFTFNIDVHGSIIGSNYVLFNGHDDIGAAVRLLAKELGVTCSVGKGPMSSDGTPLAAVGIPNVQFARGGGSVHGHTSDDHVRYTSPDSLARAGEFAELFLRRYVTEARAMPFPREIPDDQTPGIKDYFKNHKDPVPGEKVEEKDKKRAAGK